MAKAIIVRRETIKPSSPTPISKNMLKLSLLDVLLPDVYVPIILVFPSSDITSTQEKLQQLKTSLSKTLSLFYPLAGRVIDDDSYVDCNDHGAEFIEAEIQCRISDFFRIPDVEMMHQFLPVAAFRFRKKAVDVAGNSLLLVQATFFECGGLVMGISISHRIADVATLTTFLKCWSSTALHGHAKEEMIPVFMGDSLIPQSGLVIPVGEIKYEYEQGNYETKRFVFDSTKIETLKTKATNPDLSSSPTTRVEAVSSLIWKCASEASRTTTGHSRPTAMCLAADLRKRTVPPLPQNYAGNLTLAAIAKMHSSEIELHDVVTEVKKEIQTLNKMLGSTNMTATQLDITPIQQDQSSEQCNRFLKGLIQDVIGKSIGGSMVTLSGGVERYIVTSWCRFDFYGVDFGWGKPAWVSLANYSVKNQAILMDAEDGKGIEAWVCLEKNVMALFESDPELLQFSKLNPPLPFI